MRNHCSSGIRTCPYASPVGPCPGFTLVEVLVSVVILAVGLTAVVASFQSSLSTLSGARDVIEANSVAQRELDAVCRDISTGVPLQARDSEGGEVRDGITFVWRVHAEPAGVSGLAAGAALYEVTASAGRRGGPAVATLTTYAAAAGGGTNSAAN